MINHIWETLCRVHSRPTTKVKIDLYGLQGKTAHITLPISHVKQRSRISHKTTTSIRKKKAIYLWGRSDYVVLSLAPSTKTLRYLLPLNSNAFSKL